MPITEAYLDIETTGLTPSGCDITVVGIYLCHGDEARVIQIVGRDICADGILEALAGIDVIYTYNGSRFDLPFIRSRLGVDLEDIFAHRDLMYDCWKRGLFGGFKSVERQLGIPRKLADVNGYQAVRLWWRYVESFDTDALNTLLEYNREDVINMKYLKDMIVDSY
jgi:uncharacterized protein YprB with RNaseH-like and TPR domain